MKNSEELQKILYNHYIESRSHHERQTKSINWIIGMSHLSVELLKQGVLKQQQFDVIQEALLNLNGDIACYENKMNKAASTG